MATKQIVYVPGKNPKPKPELHRELLWCTLVEGVRRADRALADTLQAGYLLDRRGRNHKPKESQCQDLPARMRASPL